MWVRSRKWACLVTWFCYHLIAQPGNKTGAPSWPDPYCLFVNIWLSNLALTLTHWHIFKVTCVVNSAAMMDIAHIDSICWWWHTSEAGGVNRCYIPRCWQRPSLKKWSTYISFAKHLIHVLRQFKACIMPGYVAPKCFGHFNLIHTLLDLINEAFYVSWKL